MAPSTKRKTIKLVGCFLLAIGFIYTFNLISIDPVAINIWSRRTFSFLLGITWLTMGIYLLTTKLKTFKDIALSNIFAPLIIVNLVVSSLRDQITYGYSQYFYWSMTIHFLVGIMIIFCRWELQRRERKSLDSS